MDFLWRETVRFGQVDAAAIVYYPRYFEMLNDCVECWFAEALDYPFATMVSRDRCGVPLVDVRVRFARASRLGDQLEFRLRLARLGRSSFEAEVGCACGGEERLLARLSHVHVELEPLRSRTIPPALRTRMSAYLADGHESVARSISSGNTVDI